MKEHDVFPLLRKQETRELVFKELLAKITRGDWKPEDKLPSENELSKAMGVSRISVREALQRLAAINLVESFQGKGTFVKRFSPHDYLDSKAPMLYMSRNDVRSVVEYRKILEVGIIDIFMKHVRPQDVELLKKQLAKMQYYYERKNLNKYKEFDVAFHMKLYEMTNNPFIIKISTIVKDIISSEIESALTEDGAREGIEFHSKMLDGIMRNDSKKLKEITKELFECIESELDNLEESHDV